MVKILIISPSKLDSDPRVYRQIKHLSKDHTITEMGIGPSHIPGVRFVPFGWKRKNIFQKLLKGIFLLTKRYPQVYWGDIDYEDITNPIQNETFDIIYANDIESLPLAVHMKKKAKIIFDAHEYSPRQDGDTLKFQFLMKDYIDFLCRRYIQQSDKMITVSWGIAKEYAKQYGINPIVITNAPNPVNLTPSIVEKNKIKMIYHGEISPSRHTETMIKMMDYLDERFILDLMIKTSDLEYLKKIYKMTKCRNNVRIIKSVEMGQIITFSNKYDVGLYILEPNNFNQEYALPNKFFEYIQARLAIAIGPSPEMAALVKKYDLGVISDKFDPESLAKKLQTLTKSKLEYYKMRSHEASYYLSSEKNLELLDNIIESVL